MNEKININFNGKEYLEYKKYFESNKLSKKEKKFYTTIGCILAIGLFSIVAIVEAFSTPQPLIFTWEGVLMFLTISAGIGWILHGTGFLIVRVK